MSIHSLKSQSAVLVLAALLIAVSVIATPAVADGTGDDGGGPSPGRIIPSTPGNELSLESVEALAWSVNITSALCFVYFR